jgi:hypothetical protein
MDPEIESRICSQIKEAVQRSDVYEFQCIVKEYPDWPSDNCSLNYPHDISVDSLEMFKAFVERFPQTKDWDCGHSGNPVGLAAVTGNIPLLKFVLEDLGHKANVGRFGYSPVRQLHSVSMIQAHLLQILSVLTGSVSKSAEREEVIKILKEHGATLEGEGVCYQKSHRLWNGRNCWHWGGKSNSTRCSWSEDKWSRPKGILEHLYNLFSHRYVVAQDI